MKILAIINLDTEQGEGEFMEYALRTKCNMYTEEIKDEEKKED